MAGKTVKDIMSKDCVTVTLQDNVLRDRFENEAARYRIRCRCRREEAHWCRNGP